MPSMSRESKLLLACTCQTYIAARTQRPD